MATHGPRRQRILVDGAVPEAEQGREAVQIMDPAAIQMVWDGFKDLMVAAKARSDTPNMLTPQQFHEAAKDWAGQFKEHTFTEDVIPYIHVKFCGV